MIIGETGEKVDIIANIALFSRLLVDLRKTPVFFSLVIIFKIFNFIISPQIIFFPFINLILTKFYTFG